MQKVLRMQRANDSAMIPPKERTIEPPPLLPTQTSSSQAESDHTSNQKIHKTFVQGSLK